MATFRRVGTTTNGNPLWEEISNVPSGIFFGAIGSILLLCIYFGTMYTLTIIYGLLFLLCLVILLIARSKTLRNRLAEYRYISTVLIIIPLLCCIFFGYQFKHVNEAERLYNHILETKINGEQKNRFQYDKKLLKKLCLDGVYNRPLTKENNKYYTQKSLEPFKIEILSFGEYQSKMEKDYSYLVYNVQDNLVSSTDDRDDIYIVADSSDKKTGKKLTKTLSNLLLLRDSSPKRNIYIIEQSDFHNFTKNTTIRNDNLNNIELPTVFLNNASSARDKLDLEELIEAGEPIDENIYNLDYVDNTYNFTILESAHTDLTGKDYDKEHTYGLIESFFIAIKRELFK